MTPLLALHGFGYDFKVSEVPLSKTEAPINRVFTIYFPDEGAKKSFFANSEYHSIKQNHFHHSVSHITNLAEYVR